MSMSKKDFVALADCIKEHNKYSHSSDVFSETQIDELARFCRKQNPRFDWSRWMFYIMGECGPNGGKVKK